ncbi:MAG TPA: HAMP domain-containing sensor histidine kinase [Anaerolineales bacterium]|nr:HAMP domain-containing sensor histidine kinase [Anaerolineales bacterium]
MINPSAETLDLLSLFASSQTSAAMLLLILALVYAWARPSMSHVGSRAWAVAAGALLTARAAWLAASTLGGTPILLHTLERFLTALGVLLLAWASLSSAPRWKIDRLATVVITLAAGLLAASMAALPSSELPFNVSWVDFAWAMAGIGLTVLAIIGLLIARPAGWRSAAAGMAALLAGFTAHIAVGPPQLDVPVFVRAGEIFGYALLAVAALRAEAQTIVTPLADLPPTSAAHVGEVLTTMARVAAVDRPEDFAELVAESVGRALRIEYCLLLTPPNASGAFSIAAGFDLIREEMVPGAPLDRASCPALHEAMASRQVEPFELGPDAPDMRTLQRILELRTSGPALYAPMADDGVLQAGLLLLTPYSRRRWSESMTATLRSLSAPIASRLAAIRRPAFAPHTPEPVGEAPESAGRIAELEAEILRLTQSPSAVSAPEEMIESERLASLRAQQQQAQETISILESEVSRLKNALAAPPPRALASEVERLNSELALALREVADLRADLRSRDEAPPPSVASPPAVEAVLDELRQPLTAISGYADLLIAQPTGLLGSTQRKFVLRIREAVQKMEATLQSFVGPPEAAPSPSVGHREPVDVLACLEDGMRALGDSLRDKNLSFRVDAPDAIPPVAGDRPSLQKALAALLNNAALATRPGREITIGVRAGSEAGAVSVSVSDAGEGIPADRLQEVFEGKAWSSLANIPGLGLPGPSLAEARASIEAAGGRIWVDSQPGIGTTFTVLLPLQREMAPPS